MDNWKTIDTEQFKIGEHYMFRHKGIKKEKVFVGKNEKGVLMFDHVGESRRSFVSNQIPKELFIEKY